MPSPFSTSLTSSTVECFLQTSSETHVPSFCNGGLTSFRRTNPPMKPTDNHQHVPTLQTHGTLPSLPHMASWQFYIHSTIETEWYFAILLHLHRQKALCFYRYRQKELKVVLGEHNHCQPDNKIVIFSVEKMITHPHFNATIFAYDIMLLKLNMKITFNDVVRPICLPHLGKSYI